MRHMLEGDLEVKAEGCACLSESCADRYEGCLKTEAIPSSVSAKLGCFGIAVCVLIANICSLYRCEQSFAIQMFAFFAKLVYNAFRGQNESAAHNKLNTSKPKDTIMAKPKTREAIMDFIRKFCADNGYPPSVREIGAAVGLSSPATIHRHIGILEKEGKLRRDPNRQRALTVLPAGLAKATSQEPATAAKAPTANLISSDTPPATELPDQPSATLAEVDSAEAASEAATEQLPDNQLAAVVDIADYRHNTRHVPLLGQVAAGSGAIAEQHVEEVMSLPEELCGSGELFMLKVRGDSMTDAAILDGDYAVARSQPTAEDGDIVVAGIHEEEATVKIFHRTGTPQGATITLTPANESHTPQEFPAQEVKIYGKLVSVLRRL